MLYYIVNDTNPDEVVALYIGIDGFTRAKNLIQALQKFDPASHFRAYITRYEYMWAIQAEEKNKYTDAPSYYLFETWDEAAEFGNAIFATFDTDCDIIELNMLGD